MAGSPGPRRFLLATGVSHYPGLADRNLPSVKQDLERVIELFRGRLGYQHVPTLGLNPTAAQLRHGLRQFFIDPDRRPEDLVVVYYVGHAERLEPTSEHVLLPRDTDPADLVASTIPTRELARWMLYGTQMCRLLVILDTCYSGSGADELVRRAFAALERPAGEVERPGILVVTASHPLQLAQAGAFASALVAAVDSLATAGHTPPHLDVGALVGVINAQGRLPGWQRARVHAIALEGELPPFVPNPRYDPRLAGLDLAVQLQAEQDPMRAQELREHFLPRGRGVEQADEPGWWFAGRQRALRDLGDWLRAVENDPLVRVVTGDPGSGKSALLGRLWLLSDPDRHQQLPRSEQARDTLLPVGGVDVAIHAHGKTTHDLLAGLCAAARIAPVQRPGELLQALSHRSRPLVVLIDALDEATDPPALARELLRPLINTTGQSKLRLLLGTRGHLLKALGSKITILDLDDPATYLDPEALLATIKRGLRELTPISPYRSAPEPLVDQVAHAVAEAAGRSFLVARIATRVLATIPTLPDPNDPIWRRGLPTTAGEAMGHDLNQRLRADDAQRAHDLLLPLAYAQGAGLPWEDLWAPLATRLARQRDPTLAYTNQDLEWLREAAGSYVIEVAEQNRSVYRLYHQALADYLRQALPAKQADELFAAFLMTHTPTRANGEQDWPQAHPYTRQHLVTHAASGDPQLLDRLLVDPGFLLAADPGRLLAASDHATSHDAKTATVAYHHTVHHLRSKHPSEHAAYLELAAHCYHATALADRIRQANPPRPWVTRWAHWSPQAGLLTLTGHTRIINALAVGELDGRAIAISGGAENTLRVWDLHTGSPIDPPLTGHTNSVQAVVVGELAGRLIAVTGSHDNTMRVWDLSSGQPIGPPLHHPSAVTAVAVGELDGRPIAVGADRELRVWDLGSGQPIGPPLRYRPLEPPFGDILRSLIVSKMDGCPIAACVTQWGTVWVWDLRSGSLVNDVPSGHKDRVSVVEFGELDGRPVTVTGSYDNTVQVWDLASGQSICPPLTIGPPPPWPL